MNAKQAIKRALRAVLPTAVFREIMRRRGLRAEGEERRELRRKIIAHLEEAARRGGGDGKALAYLRGHALTVFPYEFAEDYMTLEMSAVSDGDMSFVTHRGKRLYFPYEPERAASIYTALLMEQDERSPHCYAPANCAPRPGDVIADIGAAEGIWALERADEAGRIYLFECDPLWIAALERTFAPWRDKVEIVKGFVGDVEDPARRLTTIDGFFADKRIDCVKADIEGAEVPMLIGGERVFSEKIDRATICAYHREDDERDIKRLLAAYGFSEISTTDRHMIFFDDPGLREPYLRRGVVFGAKG